MSGPVTVKLRVPIQFGTQQIAELVIRSPRAGDYRGLVMTEETAATDFPLKLAGRLSGQPDAVINLLENEDWIEVRALVLGFIAGSPEIGKTP